MSKKVLVISSKTNEARHLARQITLAGYGVSGIATDETTVLEKVENEKPDVIALDIAYVNCPDKLAFFTHLNNKYAIPYLTLAEISDNRFKWLNRNAFYGLWDYRIEAKDIADTFIQVSAHTKNGNATNGNAIINAIPNESHIIGTAPTFEAAMILSKKVATTDVTILLTGETGSGKEVFAKYIHSASRRHSEKLICVNCAAIPNNLVESELFGHEKGSFTGATEKRLGKFRMAHKGTLFLDEIGELPLKAQSKLLRSLQEKEVESVGGLEKTKIDVRFIAATNRDLKQMVTDGTFRADLYFRLNVFPIHLPPLRDRVTDILPLATHFLQQNAQQWDKIYTGFTKPSIKLLEAYAWPGNVRELEHVVKRAALLSTKEYVEITKDHFGNPDAFNTTPVNGKPQTLEAIERNAIIETLILCKGKIRGKGGAATVLNIHPNTLDFKIKKLGIEKTKLFN